MSKRGLPMQAKMRHDSHFVDALTERFGGAVGKFLPITDIETNPDQPRHTVGDLTDLKASIESKGILEPILVRPTENGRYQIISGERRFRAALEAGLSEVPTIEFDVPANEVLEIALVENLHRKDLTPFEEAEGFQSLIERHGYTHQHVSETVGKSRVAITESLTLMRIPEDLREICRRADIDSKSLLLGIARSETPEGMEAKVRAVIAGATRDAMRQEKKESEEKPSRPRPFQFRYAPKNSPFRLNLAFNRSRVGKEEVVEALQKIIDDIRGGSIGLKKGR